MLGSAKLEKTAPLTEQDVHTKHSEVSSVNKQNNINNYDDTCNLSDVEKLVHDNHPKSMGCDQTNTMDLLKDGDPPYKDGGSTEVDHPHIPTSNNENDVSPMIIGDPRDTYVNRVTHPPGMERDPKRETHNQDKLEGKNIITEGSGKTKARISAQVAEEMSVDDIVPQNSSSSINAKGTLSKVGSRVSGYYRSSRRNNAKDYEKTYKTIQDQLKSNHLDMTLEERLKNLYGRTLIELVSEVSNNKRLLQGQLEMIANTIRGHSGIKSVVEAGKQCLVCFPNMVQRFRESRCVSRRWKKKMGVISRPTAMDVRMPLRSMETITATDRPTKPPELVDISSEQFISFFLLQDETPEYNSKNQGILSFILQDEVDVKDESRSIFRTYRFDSPVAILRLFVCTVISIFNFFISSTFLFFVVSNPEWRQWGYDLTGVNLILDVVYFFFAIVAAFGFTIADWETQVEMNDFKTIKRTLMSDPFFYMDCFSIPPFILDLIGLGEGSWEISNGLRLLRVWRIVALDASSNSPMRLLRYSIRAQIIRIIIQVFMIEHVLCCLYFSLCPEDAKLKHYEKREQTIQEGDNFGRDSYKFYLFQVALGLGPYTREVYSATEMVFVTCLGPLGAITMGAIFAQVNTVLSRGEVLTTRHVTQMMELSQAMSAMRMSHFMKKRILAYHEFVHTRHTISDDMMHCLSTPLQIETRLFQYFSLIAKAQFFHDSTPDSIKHVVDLLTNLTYSPMDFIIRKGEMGNEMFFVMKGITQVIVGDTTQNTKVVKECRSGDYFGEVGLFTNHERFASVRSITFCVLAMLHRSGLDVIATDNPQAWRAMVRRMKHVLKVASITLDTLKYQILDQYFSLEEAFGAMDFDGSGSIDLKEFSKLVWQKFKVTTDDARLLFNQIDSNMDGIITCEEWLITFTRVTIDRVKHDVQVRYGSIADCFKVNELTHDMVMKVEDLLICLCEAFDLADGDARVLFTYIDVDDEGMLRVGSFRDLLETDIKELVRDWLKSREYGIEAESDDRSQKGSQTSTEQDVKSLVGERIEEALYGDSEENPPLITSGRVSFLNPGTATSARKIHKIEDPAAFKRVRACMQAGVRLGVMKNSSIPKSPEESQGSVELKPDNWRINEGSKHTSPKSPGSQDAKALEDQSKGNDEEGEKEDMDDLISRPGDFVVDVVKSKFRGTKPPADFNFDVRSVKDEDQSSDEEKFGVVTNPSKPLMKSAAKFMQVPEQPAAKRSPSDIFLLPTIRADEGSFMVGDINPTKHGRVSLAGIGDLAQRVKNMRGMKPNGTLPVFGGKSGRATTGGAALLGVSMDEESDMPIFGSAQKGNPQSIDPLVKKIDVIDANIKQLKSTIDDLKTVVDRWMLDHNSSGGSHTNRPKPPSSNQNVKFRALEKKQGRRRPTTNTISFDVDVDDPLC